MVLQEVGQTLITLTWFPVNIRCATVLLLTLLCLGNAWVFILILYNIFKLYSFHLKLSLLC